MIVLHMRFKGIFCLFSFIAIVLFSTGLHARSFERCAGRWSAVLAPPKRQPASPSARLLLKPELKALIIIDPGHGGKDLGAYSQKIPKYQEKFLTLSTAFMLKEYLTQMGYAVLMTRAEDVFVTLPNRAAFANKRQPQLFVSLHYNSAPNREAEGIEIFYYRSDTDKNRSKQSMTLAQKILKGMLANTEARSRGVKHGNLAVIRETNMPAVLVEGGFLTNADEIVKLKDGAYLKKIAWGIAQGIHDYLEN